MFLQPRALASLAFAALIGFSSSAIAAEPVTLKFATQNTETAWTTQNCIKPYLEKIEKEANGSVKFELYANQTLCKGNQSWQSVAKGIADLSWVSMGVYTGMNLLMEIINQPGMGFDSGMEGAERVYKIASEVPISMKPYAANKVLALFPGDPGTGVIISTKPIRTLEDLKGKKIRCAAGAYLDMLKALGATPVVMSMNDCYMGMQKGTIDGVLGDIDSYLSFRFYEVAKYCLHNVPRGVTLFMIAMNKKAYDKLPAEAKKAFDANSGVEGGKWLAEHWGYNQRPLFKVATEKGTEVIRLSDDEKARWTALLAPLWDAWLEKCAKAGFKDEAPTVLRLMQGK